MKKYKPNWHSLRKTITIINEDLSIYAEYDYIDWLQFRVEYLQSKRLQGMNFYVRNEYGGVDKIDKFSNITGGNDFTIINDLLRDIIKAQMELRKKELN